MRWRSGLVVAVLLAAALQGCGARESGAPAASTRGGAVMLNGVSVAAVLDAMTKAKLPVLNARDATASRCPAAGCLQAIDTDTVSIMKFPSSGRAELYAAGVRDMLQVEDIVVVFAPMLTSEQKVAYEKVVENAMR
jgi:hypothetical protein